MADIAQVLADHLGADMVRVSGRLGMALALGLVLGIDREIRRKPAGLRSHMLVSLAAASLTIMTFIIVDSASMFGDVVRADPLRLMEAVVGGVAFLGAGAIIQARGAVQGITTGASLWLAGAIGVGCGAGLFKLALLTTLLAFLVLSVLGWVERRFMTSPRDVGDR